MSARDVIAEQVQTFWDEGQPVGHVAKSVAEDIISALTASGYRIVGPDELDRETIEAITGFAPPMPRSKLVAPPSPRRTAR